MKRFISVILLGFVMIGLITGCGKSQVQHVQASAGLWTDKNGVAVSVGDEVFEEAVEAVDDWVEDVEESTYDSIEEPSVFEESQVVDVEDVAAEDEFENEFDAYAYLTEENTATALSLFGDQLSDEERGWCLEIADSLVAFYDEATNFEAADFDELINLVLIDGMGKTADGTLYYKDPFNFTDENGMIILDEPIHGLATYAAQILVNDWEWERLEYADYSDDDLIELIVQDVYYDVTGFETVKEYNAWRLENGESWELQFNLASDYKTDVFGTPTYYFECVDLSVAILDPTSDDAILYTDSYQSIVPDSEICRFTSDDSDMVTVGIMLFELSNMSTKFTAPKPSMHTILSCDEDEWEDGALFHTNSMKLKEYGPYSGEFITVYLNPEQVDSDGNHVFSTKCQPIEPGESVLCAVLFPVSSAAYVDYLSSSSVMGFSVSAYVNGGYVVVEDFETSYDEILDKVVNFF